MLVPKADLSRRAVESLGVSLSCAFWLALRRRPRCPGHARSSQPEPLSSEGVIAGLLSWSPQAMLRTTKDDLFDGVRL